MLKELFKFISYTTGYVPLNALALISPIFDLPLEKANQLKKNGDSYLDNE